jgi:monolysocardiolipin acyltransferase
MIPSSPASAFVASFAKYLTNVHSSSCQVNGLDKFLQILADEARRGEGRGVLTYANHISVVDDPAVWGCMPMSAFQDSASTRWTLGASDILFTNR